MDFPPKTDHKSVENTEVLRGDLIASNARLFNDFDSPEGIFADHRGYYTSSKPVIINDIPCKEYPSYVMPNRDEEKTN